MVTQPRLNSLFRIQTILILAKDDMSGYDLAKELEEKTGKKPSSGKIYPFLHQLEETGYITEIEIEDDTERSRKVYQLTDDGKNLVDELLDKMGNILDARLEQMLDVCASCTVKLYDSKLEGKNNDGKIVKFCCEHCMSYYYNQKA